MDESTSRPLLPAPDDRVKRESLSSQHAGEAHRDLTRQIPAVVVIEHRGLGAGVPRVLLDGPDVAVVGVERGRDAGVPEPMRPGPDPHAGAKRRNHSMQPAARDAD